MLQAIGENSHRFVGLGSVLGLAFGIRAIEETLQKVTWNQHRPHVHEPVHIRSGHPAMLAIDVLTIDVLAIDVLAIGDSQASERAVEAGCESCSPFSSPIGVARLPRLGARRSCRYRNSG